MFARTAMTSSQTDYGHNFRQQILLAHSFSFIEEKDTEDPNHVLA
jgi:hypothetical protein